MLKRFTSYVTVFVIFLLICTAPINIKAQDEKDIKIQQLEANLRLYEDAIKEVSAPTTNETVLIWAKGVATRNGVIQYSVLTNRLKEEFKRTIDREIWVTGVSSPWVVVYTIVDSKSIGDKYEVTVEFTWATSTGPAGKTRSKLTIIKEGGKWRIDKYEDVRKN